MTIKISAQQWAETMAALIEDLAIAERFRELANDPALAAHELSCALPAGQQLKMTPALEAWVVVVARRRVTNGLTARSGEIIEMLAAQWPGCGGSRLGPAVTQVLRRWGLVSDNRDRRPALPRSKRLTDGALYEADAAHRRARMRRRELIAERHRLGAYLRSAPCS